MHGWDATLMAAAEDPSEWQTLDQMPMARAAMWVVQHRLTPQ